MKSVISIAIVVVFIGLCISMCNGGCADEKSICLPEGGCHKFQPYGLFSLNKENENIEYEVSTGNVVWSCIFSASVFVPVILIGWYLYEPVGLVDRSRPVGVKGGA